MSHTIYAAEFEQTIIIYAAKFEQTIIHQHVLLPQESVLMDGKIVLMEHP
jgi:hypothetical protein